MNSPHHPHHHEHHDVHQQRLLWFFSFCNQRSSSSSSSSGGSNSGGNRRSSRRKSASNRNKFAMQYQQQLQQQQKQSSNVFGLDLTEHTHRYSINDSIPCIVKSCTRFIEKHGIIFGIYRLSGMRVNIHKLRQDFDKNPKTSRIDGEAISNDAHAVACVLKQYFRELPIPLLTFHMYEKFIELFKQSIKNEDSSNNDQTRTSLDLSCHNIGSDQEDPIYDIEHDSTLEDDQVKESNSGSKLSDKVQVQTLGTTLPPPEIRGSIDQPTPDITVKRSSPASEIIKSTDYKKISNANLRAKRQAQFTSSASDSQLISLSSMVTTTTSDVKYHVKLHDLRKLLLQLPRPHYQTLKFLVRHLAFIAANGRKTGMDSKNVAIVWAPNLLKPRELELSAGVETLQVIGLQAVITEQLIKHHKFLFDDGDDGPQSRPATPIPEVEQTDEPTQEVDSSATALADTKETTATTAAIGETQTNDAEKVN